ncbi:MAG: hypothetical protein IT226_06420 [Flavobacteriales bacterium]|nr:hypothetical protein [Flavobacteriales bacterium]
MRIITLALFATLVAPLAAQQVDWLTSAPMAYTMNPEMPDQVLASAPGHLVGMRQTTGTFVYGQTVYGQAIMERLDPTTGASVWSCALFDSVHVSAAAVGADGKAYFAGSFMGNMGWCDGSNLGGVAGQAAWYENRFLVAVDLTTGFVEWARNISMTQPNAGDIASLAIDPQGNLWYAFSEWGIGKVIRVNALGNDVETRLIDGPRLIGTISFDPWGGLYVSGSADNNGFAFGGQAYQGYGTTGYSMFVLRYQPDGTAGFAQFADDVTFHNPTVVATTDGHAYIGGAMLLEGTSWGGIAFNGPDWVYATFIAKLDSTGTFLWGAESDPAGGPITGDMNRSKGPCLAVDANDNPYLFGNLRGLVDWGNSVVSNGLTLGARSMTIVSFAPDGTPQWTATSNPIGFSNNAQTITALAESDAIHFAGHISGEFMFPPHTTGAVSTQSAMVGRIGGLSTSVVEQTHNSSITLWPNPVNDVLNVEVNIVRPLPADLFNGAGQRVQALLLRPGRNVIDMNDRSSGPYLLRLADGTCLRVVKD